MNAARAVTLKLHAIAVARFLIFSSARTSGFLRKGCEDCPLRCFHLHPCFPILSHARLYRQLTASATRLCQIEVGFSALFLAEAFRVFCDSGFATSKSKIASNI